MKLHLKILIYISFILFSFSVSGENESYNFSSLSKFLNKEISKGRYPGFLTLIKRTGSLSIRMFQALAMLKIRLLYNETLFLGFTL